MKSVSPKSTVPLFRPADLALTVLLGAASFCVVRGGRVAPAGSRVVVCVDGAVRTTADLARDTVFSARGRLGDTVIEVRGGKARILESPCPRKICRHQGAVSSFGGALVCIPNRVTVTVEVRGTAERGVDGVTP